MCVYIYIYIYACMFVYFLMHLFSIATRVRVNCTMISSASPRTSEDSLADGLGGFHSCDPCRAHRKGAPFIRSWETGFGSRDHFERLGGFVEWSGFRPVVLVV